jgi:hypothetical protein
MHAACCCRACTASLSHTPPTQPKKREMETGVCLALYLACTLLKYTLKKETHSCICSLSNDSNGRMALSTQLTDAARNSKAVTLPVHTLYLRPQSITHNRWSTSNVHRQSKALKQCQTARMHVTPPRADIRERCELTCRPLSGGTTHVHARTAFAITGWGSSHTVVLRLMLSRQADAAAAAAPSQGAQAMLHLHQSASHAFQLPMSCNSMRLAHPANSLEREQPEHCLAT